ncbi:MAG: hypothetical protein AB1779_07440 [Candidatus Thermoplasmatota archaeon]
MKNKKGIASVIGTMTAVVIFVLIFSIILSQWVPVWVEDIEAEHMSTVRSQFATFKSILDSLILQNNKNLTMSCPITLGSKGVPVLTGGTTGVLTFSAYKSSVNVTTEDLSINATGSGKMKFDSRNRYFTQQKYIYECGGVVLSQSGGDVVIGNPQITISNSTSGIELTTTLLFIIGSEFAISGTTTEEIRSTLLYYSAESYSWSSGKNVSINISTDYKTAWEKYFNSSFDALGLIENTDYKIVKGEKYINTTIYNVKKMTLGKANIQIGIG